MFETPFVRNPEDRFSHDKAHIYPKLLDNLLESGTEKLENSHFFFT